MAGDLGAHGALDHRAGSSDPMVWASLHRRGLTVGALGTAAALLVTRVARADRAT